MLAGLAGSACQQKPGPDTLVVAIEVAPRGFDPRFSTTSIYSARIMQLIYDTLVVKNTEFEFVPWLAESFQESEDRRTFTFKLRDGIKFHNGKPLTSADVKYTFDSLLAPELKSPIRPALEKITSIEAPDQQTVIFQAREPFYTFVGNLPAIGIIPEGAGPELIDSPIGTGPYKFVSYREGEYVELVANNDYWSGQPSIPRVRIKVVADNSTRQAELMSGAVDLAYNSQFDPETIRALGRRGDIQVVISEGSNVGYLGVNLSAGSITSNQKLRQAIAHAIDRETIIDRLLRRQARRADAIMPPEHWAYEENISTYDHDPERAKRLLDEAGFDDPDGDGPLPRVTVSLMTSTTQLSRNIAVIMQEQLRQVGIRLDLLSLEAATLFDRLAKAQFDLYYLISIGANQSTDVFQFVYHSRYQDAEFNDAIARLRAANELAVVVPLFEKLEAIIYRREYCFNGEVARLADQAAALDSRRFSAEKKRLYLDIARKLTDRGGQNRMRYCNPTVDKLIVEAEAATERSNRIELYSDIQRTVSDELPQIYLWYPANVLVAQKRVDNIHTEPSGSWSFFTELTLDKD